LRIRRSDNLLLVEIAHSISVIVWLCNGVQGQLPADQQLQPTGVLIAVMMVVGRIVVHHGLGLVLVELEKQV